jgi:hypothetical protein
MAGHVPGHFCLCGVSSDCDCRPRESGAPVTPVSVGQESDGPEKTGSLPHRSAAAYWIPAFAGMTPRHASSPVFFAAPGRPSSLSVPLGRSLRGWNAARRILGRSTPCEACASWRRTRAPRRSMAAFLSPGPCFRAPTDGSSPPLSGDLRLLRRRLVQPSKAAGPSAGGRLPGTSRRWGYEPRPRAPHPVPPSKRLATTPLGGPDVAEYNPYRIKVKSLVAVAALVVIPAKAGIQ